MDNDTHLTLVLISLKREQAFKMFTLKIIFVNVMKK